MYLNTIKSKNLVFTDKNDIKYESYENGKINILCELPKLKIPFGIEHNYNKYELKFELDDSCKYVKLLIQKLEKNLSKKLDMSIDESLRSNIRVNQKYNDLLTVKVPNYRNKFSAKINSRNDNVYLPTFYDIQPNTYASAKIHIKKYWKLDDKFGLLIELKSLTIL
jgi:hypothetical protein